jgi:hypothetical protein
LPVATTALALARPEDLKTALPQPVVTSFSFSWAWAIAGILGIVTVTLLLLRLLPTGAAGTGGQPPARRVPAVAVSPTRIAALLAEQGQRAMMQGNLAQAYDHFSRAIELDPANAAAWLGKGLVAQQETEKRICFQRVLALEPANTQAQAELQRLDPSIKGLVNHENYSS